SASSSATLAAPSRPWPPIRPTQPPRLKPSTPAGSWMTPSSEAFSLTTILPIAFLLAAGRLGSSTSIRRFALASTRPPKWFQGLDSLADKATREHGFRHMRCHRRVTHSRNQEETGGNDP